MRLTSRPFTFAMSLIALSACPLLTAQSNQQWMAYKQQCRLPPGLDYQTWTRQGSHCPAREAGNPNNNNGAAAAASAAAAAAKRQRDAELERQRIDADNKRRAEEAEERAKFDRDKRGALGQLEGVANGDDFDSASGLKGVGPTDSGLKDDLDSGDASGLKTLPDAKTGLHQDVNTDPMVVDAANVPTGLPPSVAAEIPDTPAGNRVRKGFEAIQDHDWKVALAWFQDALNHDPGNAGIQRLIELAQYTMERENRPHPSAPPARPAAQPTARDKAQMAALDKQLDDRMNADLAAALRDFNLNYLPKHPELLKPVKPSAAVQTKKPDTAGATPGPSAAEQKANWKAFFGALFTPPRRVLTPASVAGVRD